MKYLTSALLLLLAGPALGQAPQTAKMGITHTTDPEVVSVLDASNTWAQIGSVDKTTHVFTPVPGPSSGGGGGPGCTGGTVCDMNTAAWAGNPVAAPTLAGVAPASGGLLPSVNAFILSTVNVAGLPSINVTDGGALSHVMNWPTTQAVTVGTLPLPSGAATFAGQNVTNPGTSATQAQAVQGVTGGVPFSTNILSGGAAIGINGSGNGLTMACTNCAGGSTGGGTPQTTNSGPINITSATTTKILSGTAGLYTYITQFNILTGSTGSVKLEYGTGTNCGTGTTFLTGAWPWSAASGISLGNGFGTVFAAIPAGNDVCVVSTGATVNMQGSFGYTQNGTLIASFGPGGTPQTTAGAALAISSATTTQIIPALASNYTYITHINVVSGSQGTMQLVYGTGTNCATVGGNITGNYPWPTNGGFSIGTGFGPIFLPVPQGSAVCLVSGGTPVSMQGSIAYTQAPTLVNSFGGGGGGGSSGGGGGGGTLSGSTDASPFAYGSGTFVPGGCVYNTTVTNLTTGTQGAFSCGVHRELFIDALTGGNIMTALSAGNVSTAPGTALPANAVVTSGVDINGKAAVRPVEPCSQPKSFIDVETTTGTGVQLVAGVSGKQIYLCSGTVIVTSAAAHISFIEGTNSTCSTGTLSVFGNAPGSVTAAHGMFFGSTGGVAPPGGNFAATAVAGDTVCLLFDTVNSPQVNVHVAYVQM